MSRPCLRPRRPLLTAAVAVAALLTCTGVAQASSIVYIKGTNVWLANPDGSAQRQLTTDGTEQLPYESPSQADDGTILVGRGLRFVKLDREGRQIGEPLPSILVGKPANAYAVGPFSPKISPDGKKLVYWIGTWSTWFDHGTNTTWTDPKDAVVWQDAVTGAQLGFTMFYSEPSWLADSSRALLSDEHNRQTGQVVVAGIGANHNDLQHFFVDGDSLPTGETLWQNVADPELSPAGDRLAVLRGNGHETIRFYDTRGAKPAVSPCWLSQPVGGSAASPTWAPDGRALAWTEGDGIWTTPVGPLDTADCSWAAPKLTIPGASQPDWGPAGVSAGAPAAAPVSAAPAAGRPPTTPRRRATKRYTGQVELVSRPGRRVSSGVQGDGWQVVFRERARGRVAYRVCVQKTGAKGVRRCWSRRTDRKGRSRVTVALFVNDRGGAGSWRARWTVRGRTVARAAFTVRPEPAGR
jgi:Tol biopolymer transport system component